MYILSENELYCKHETEMHFFYFSVIRKKNNKKQKPKILQCVAMESINYTKAKLNSN